MATESSSKRATVLLLCGLPGSGKSTLVNELITSLAGIDKILVIDYDRLADEVDQTPNIDGVESINASITQESSTLGHSFGSKDLEAWRKSRCVALNELTNALHCHFSDEDKSKKSMLVIMDDNFHLKSMRREIYRACQESVAEFTSTIGFVTLYVSTPLEVCIFRNNRREGKNRVPVDVIHRMSDVIEPPDPSKPYGSFEKVHLTLSAQDIDDKAMILQRIGASLNEAIKSPVVPSNNLSEEELAKLEAERTRQREATLKCQGQRIDQLLRKLVGAVGRTDKSKSKAANEARKTILDGCKSERQEKIDYESLVNEFVLHVTRNNDDTTPSDILVKAVRFAFNDFINEPSR
jgi:tRNA uridine 5-carbamoylmethylation protein Kti12